MEVIHGTGPGGHSHFYLASQYDANDGGDDHHSEEDETVKRLVAEIPLRTELSDVVKWLPDVAAKSHANEEDWTAVSDMAKSLAQIIAAVPQDAADDDFRDTWKQQSKTIEPMIAKLQTLAAKSTGDAK